MVTWFEHRSLACFGHLEGVEAERCYGVMPAEVVQYGHWSWPSWSVLMVHTIEAWNGIGTLEVTA